jgi:hypothetical protein
MFWETFFRKYKKKNYERVEIIVNKNLIKIE